MTTINRILRNLLENRSKRLAVATVIFVFSVVIVLPVADEYRATRQRRVGLERAFSESGKLAGRRNDLESDRETLAVELARLQGQSIPAERVGEFRTELVELIRRSSCNVRQIREGQCQQRTWRDGDNPLSETNRIHDTEKEEEATELQLNTHPLSVTITGSYVNVRSFLKRFHGMERMVYTQSLSIRPEGDGTENVHLHLELLLFSLEQERPAKDDPAARQA